MLLRRKWVLLVLLLLLFRWPLLKTLDVGTMRGGISARTGEIGKVDVTTADDG